MYDPSAHPIISDTSGNSQNGNLRAAKRPVFLCPSDAYYNSQPYYPAASNSGAGPNWARGNYAANGSITQVDLGQVALLGPHSKGWSTPGFRGVMGVSEACTIKDIIDGTAHTCLLGEIRAGVCSVDPRGIWAMGAVGSSFIMGHSTTDDHGPNCIRLPVKLRRVNRTAGPTTSSVVPILKRLSAAAPLAARAVLRWCK